MAPLSDIDIAVYFSDATSREKFFELKIALLSKLYPLLETEKIDLVILNESPLSLTYRVLKDGEIIVENDPQKRITFYENTIIRYLDFLPFITAMNKQIQKNMLEGTYFD